MKEILPVTPQSESGVSRDILKLPKKEKEEWKTACQDKLEALKRWEVFEITDLPKGHKIIKNRWVFDIKTDGCKKAYLVAKGFSQVEEIDFFEVCFRTVCFMLVLPSLEDWHVQGLDVWNAFPYGKLDEEFIWNNLKTSKSKDKKIKSYIYAMHFMVWNKLLLPGGRS
jgi:Reverse transcriptase (RNA-dependent DNA polymerase)